MGLTASVFYHLHNFVIDVCCDNIGSLQNCFSARVTQTIAFLRTQETNAQCRLKASLSAAIRTKIKRVCIHIDAKTSTVSIKMTLVTSQSIHLFLRCRKTLMGTTIWIHNKQLLVNNSAE
ncbi:hypothetical protein JTE90_001073 [Oedothorax gibbosus]|uniref:Uncharacterized protein n=1 Tax=Oedothorax gibbosus TaxID=931172 RepID=A0AAV6TMI7_9ARAC|nr:hypothetical protein JTE90_001073 [Oedothorax gibbosus]